MSLVADLKIEYNRFLALGVIALARGEFVGARAYLTKAAKALNELAVRRTGVNKDLTQEWVFDIVKELNNIDRKISNEQAKDKLTKMIADRGGLQTEENERQGKFASPEIPKTTFDDIAGLEEVKEAVMYKVIYPRKHPELYDTFKKRSGGGILLYGLPGTGKTLIAEAIAHETNATFFPIKCSDLGSKWFGETEQNIRDIFNEARATQNAVIFFDEIETDDPAGYVRQFLKDSQLELTVEEKGNGVVTIYAVADGMTQKFIFTPI